MFMSAATRMCMIYHVGAENQPGPSERALSTFSHRAFSPTPPDACFKMDCPRAGKWLGALRAPPSHHMAGSSQPSMTPVSEDLTTHSDMLGGKTCT